ncbi:tRNA (adenosine(37)-N6)-threonylcarbamoyltransferase complex dimerization subunit type 1 TsaB [uncultured Bifidobacterium sp.]|uniref:tRNA (adenosine(37)-N6)-threonylcarbamoyltransferase complex dimerization subunit type 1 TsaB n=1 Tax=uncultured Bifidobacterium sp. TaxID=165187 RepID=UPI0026258548|nr:tRNA (adenosine(37)-N6)-threonylcarbamoyltransferase complex dimerization subunit type 1 TsaB [uncultured Bifidobacterium sp.]
MTTDTATAAGMTAIHKTLVVDTAFGSTVGVVGCDPVVESDSRGHVERLMPDIIAALAAAGLDVDDVSRIVVGVGPAPYTGLRVGIVTAKALAYATGAEIAAIDDLTPQSLLTRCLLRGDPRLPSINVRVRVGVGVVAGTGAGRETDSRGCAHLTLALNDARRRQLYFLLMDENGNPLSDGRALPRVRSSEAMGIDYPDAIVERINREVETLRAGTGLDYAVDVAGRGVARYDGVWDGLRSPGLVTDAMLLDAGGVGLELMEEAAVNRGRHDVIPVEPLYLRRPDVSVPRPLKQVLGSGPAKDVAR